MTVRSIKPRLVSLDQFRGYTVAGMCLVNFLAPFAVIHPLLKHNDTYFSYADSIMPGFLFVVGFAFRLTYLKRRNQAGRLPTARSYVRRSGKLLLFSLLIYAFIGDLPRWFHFQELPPEFQSFREQPPRIKSFATLKQVSRAAEPKENWARDARPVGIPAAATPPRPSQSAAIERTLAEGESFVPAAVARLRAWRELSGFRRLLIHWRILAARLIKSDLWETLAIIGATQLVVLPWIGCRFWTRLVVLACLGLAHGLLAYSFNWDFLYGVNGNWMSKVWMTGDDRSWDGGILGPLCWGIALIGGTLAYDLVAASVSQAVAVRKLVVWGAAFMAAGYSMSCLTRLYDLTGSELVVLRESHLRQDAAKTWLAEVIQRQRALLKNQQQRLDDAQPEARKEIEEERDRIQGTILVLEDQRRADSDLELAESPVLPPWRRLQGRTLRDLLAEPPFVAPPADDPRIDPPPRIEHRLRNFWMLGKRMPNVSFMTFATGFEFALFALFVTACDIGGLSLGLFRTLGTNPLAAYFIHGMAGLALALLVPHDASLTFCLAGFAIAFAITYALVRLLEQRGLYWRL